MNRDYQELASARFRSQLVEGKLRIEIPARKNWFVLLFLCFWLTMWTFGGGTAIYSLFSQFSFFIIFWLCGWAMGWVFAAGTIAWQLSGQEVARIVGSDLEVGYRIAGIERMKLYRGCDIRNLSPADSISGFGQFSQISIPFFKQVNFGAVKFDYGARTFRFGSGLEEAEGRAIVEQLQSALPYSARQVG